METKDNRTIQAMRRYGGGFVKGLGEAALNTDCFHYYASNLALALRGADKDNTERILKLVNELGWAYHATQADRITRIKETFPEAWARYEALGEEDVRAMERLEGESAADLPMG